MDSISMTNTENNESILYTHLGSWSTHKPLESKVVWCNKVQGPRICISQHEISMKELYIASLTNNRIVNHDISIITLYHSINEIGWVKTRVFIMNSIRHLIQIEISPKICPRKDFAIYIVDANLHQSRTMG